MAWLEAVCNIVKKLAVFVLLGIEEEPKVVEHVIKQVVHDDAAFDAPWQRIYELIVFLHLAEAVVGPEVLEMLVYLSVETVGQRLVLSESGQEGHPVVQLESLLFDAQVLVERADDFYEGTHDKREEGHACEHDANSYYLL